MTQAERVSTHNFFTRLDAIVELVEQADWPDSEEVRDCLQRCRWIEGDLRDRAKDTNAVSVASLTAASQAANNLVSYLTHIRGGSEQHVAQAQTSIDEMLTHAASWPPSRGIKATQSIREASASHQADLEAAFEDFKIKTKNERAATSEQLSEIRTTNETVQAAAAAAQEGIQNREARLDQALDDLDERYTEFEKTWTSKAEAAREADAKIATDTLEEAKADVAALLDELRGMRESATKTLAALGRDTTATAWGTYANEQKHLANAWNAGSLIALILAAAVISWALRGAEGVTWQLVAFKSAVGLLVLTAAGYCGRQAHGHRTEERKARHYELGLASLDTFLADTDKERRDEVRAHLATRLFGDPQPTQAEPADTETAVDVLTAVVKRLAGRETGTP